MLEFSGSRVNGSNLMSGAGARALKWCWAGVIALSSVAWGQIAAHIAPDTIIYRPLLESPVGGRPDARAWIISAGEVDALVEGGNLVYVELPIGLGRQAVADLRREIGVADDAVIEVVRDNGLVTKIAPTIQIFSGQLVGEPESKVFIGISGQQVHGWVQLADQRWLITTPPGTTTVLTYDSAAVGHRQVPAVCAGELFHDEDAGLDPTGPDVGDLDPMSRSTSGQSESGYGERVANCRAVRMAIECDNEFVRLFGNAVAATDYAVFLTAASSDIFNREVNLGFNLTYLRVWEAADPWTGANTSAQLAELRSYWRANMTSTVRSTVHLLSGRSLGGGIAYIRGACSTTNGYGVSANLGGSFPFPVTDNSSANWDIFVFAHELGHMFGTEHTHNGCAYSPIIDGCGLSSSEGCENGTKDCATASARNGTIMSYCHTCSGGIANVRMTFGDRVRARMDSYLSGISCDVNTAGPALISLTSSAPAPLCPGTSITLTAAATGSQLRYQWFRNGGRMYASTQPTLLLATPQNGDRYDVMIYSPCGMITTLNGGAGAVSAYTVQVASSPSITQQPQNSEACSGGAVSVQVVAAPGSASTYRWEVRNLNVTSGWEPMSDGPVIIGEAQVAVAQGSSTAQLTLTGFAPAWRTSALSAARGVRCVLSGPCPGTSSRTSVSAIITFCPAEFNCDGGVDGEDVDAFFQAWSTAQPEADLNADGGIDGGDVSSFFGFWTAGC